MNTAALIEEALNKSKKVVVDKTITITNIRDPMISMFRVSK